jgi:hypothetical protein
MRFLIQILEFHGMAGTKDLHLPTEQFSNFLKIFDSREHHPAVGRRRDCVVVERI